MVSFATPRADQVAMRWHILASFQQVQPDAQSTVRIEAAAYAAAVITLNDAQRAANEAYRRWYQCEYQGKDVQPTVDVPSADLSVLVRD